MTKQEDFDIVSIASKEGIPQVVVRDSVGMFQSDMQQ